MDIFNEATFGSVIHKKVPLIWATLYSFIKPLTYFRALVTSVLFSVCNHMKCQVLTSLAPFDVVCSLVRSSSGRVAI